MTKTFKYSTTAVGKLVTIASKMADHLGGKLTFTVTLYKGNSVEGVVTKGLTAEALSSYIDALNLYQFEFQENELIGTTEDDIEYTVGLEVEHPEVSFLDLFYYDMDSANEYLDFGSLYRLVGKPDMKSFDKETAIQLLSKVEDEKVVRDAFYTLSKEVENRKYEEEAWGVALSVFEPSVYVVVYDANDILDTCLFEQLVITHNDLVNI